VTARDLARVAVVGAGVIGSSVAHAAAAAGLRVTLIDRDPAVLPEAARRIRDHDRLGRLTGGPADGDLMGRISMTTELGVVAGADVVIENVTEDWEVKAALYRQFETRLAPATVIAVNTSAIPVTSLADLLTHRNRVVGLHFMNPVARIGTIEVVRGLHTSEAALATVLELTGRLGKRAVIVRDSAGFVINRVLMVVLNLAAQIVDEGVATPEAVDTLFKGCLGHAMGPLRTADLIGIDTVVRTLEELAGHYGAATFAPVPALRRMVDAGLLGVKAGAGFYVYDAGRG
jgi:3-hydroxyacyl-CoA dehydrogenase